MLAAWIRFGLEENLACIKVNLLLVIALNFKQRTALVEGET